MTFTRLAVVGGVVILGFLCWLAAIGLTAITEVLVTFFALTVLVAGGNWLSGRSGRSRGAPPLSSTATSGPEAAEATDGEAGAAAP